MPEPPNTPTFEVELPAGGRMYLQSAEEVELWNNSAQRYVDDYHLTKLNDLVLIGVIIQQQITVFRAQRALNGLEPELDNAGVPTGRHKQVKLTAQESQRYLAILNDASAQIQKIEKSLGIDKATREAGGQHTVANYIVTLKKAAHARGIHISRRVLAYEGFCMDLRTRLRMLKNLDAEDRAYHNITPEKILEWAGEQLAMLEEVDKNYAKERGKVYVGRL